MSEDLEDRMSDVLTNAFVDLLVPKIRDGSAAEVVKSGARGIYEKLSNAGPPSTDEAKGPERFFADVKVVGEGARMAVMFATPDNRAAYKALADACADVLAIGFPQK